MTLKEVYFYLPRLYKLWGSSAWVGLEKPLCKRLYNLKSSSMNKCSFLFDVRDAAAKNDLHSKQKKLLQDLGFKDLSIDNVEEGKEILAVRLRSLTLFLVLDDVDHQDQLDALLPRIDSLGCGSVIIVTSRELGVLTSWGISSIYKMKGLDLGHSRQLLCWHAFLQPSPLEGFEALVEIFVNVCNGLPLSLKVFGGQLYGKPKDHWESQLDKISRLLPNDIKVKLKVSYDALDEEEQEIFLDIACFYIGEEKSLTIAVWNGSGWSGVHSWETLVNKCLVELDEKNCTRMHDSLRDLGRGIAIRQSPYRLWLPEQITHIQKQATKERVLIRGIKAETSKFYEDFPAACSSHYQTPFQKCMELVRNSSRDFRLRRPLELLVVRDYYFTEEFATQSTGLVWLRWVNFQKRTFPSWFSLRNLSVLELHDASQLEELWTDNAIPPLELRVLIITHGSRFRGFQEKFCLLQWLEHLELNKCTGLTALPNRFGDLRNLRHIDLRFCKELNELPVYFKQLIHLQYINLSGCSKLIFTSENVDILDNMTQLEILNFQGCKELQELPRQITNQGSLRELYLGDTSLRELPSKIGELSKLEALEIGSKLLTSLPTSIGNLSSLKNFQICECSKLESLPDSMGNLNLLEQLRIARTQVKYLLKTLAQLGNLQRLHISSCPVRELDFGSGSFSSSLSNLKSIDLRKTLVSRISISQQCCPSLETLQLRHNDHLIEIQTLTISVKAIHMSYCKMLKSISGICGLVNLQKLVIWRCVDLHELPSFAELVSLQEFQIQDRAGEHKKIEGLEQSRSLVTLRALTCWKVPAIQSLDHIQRLRTLELSGCNISAIEPCLQSIKKWPAETIICARAVRGVDSIANSFAFPSLALVDSCVEEKTENDRKTIVRLKCGQKHSSNAGAMVCFVINSKSKAIYLHLQTENGKCRTSDMWLEEGKWVWIVVFTHASWLMAEEYQIIINRVHRNWKQLGNDKVRGMLAMGEEEKVVDGFYHLLARWEN